MRTDDTLPRDDEVDADLRAAYRRIATETAPPHLDKAVLATAASARAPAGRGLWQWRRPLAWVTMIGLSFAIVLEVNRSGSDLVPELEDTLPRTAPAAREDDKPAAVAVDAEPISDSRSRFAPQTVRRESVDDAGRAARQALEESVATESELAKRSRNEELETMSAPAAAELRESDDVSMDYAAPPSGAGAPGTVASESAERLRADADRAADLYIQRGADAAPACDAATRADPERWRDCIAELVKGRRNEEARVEIGLFRQAFPDEPSPVPVK